MDTIHDAEEYLSELLGKSTPEAREFQREFLSRWHPPGHAPPSPSGEGEELLERLVRPQQEEMVLFESRERRGEQEERKVSWWSKERWAKVRRGKEVSCLGLTLNDYCEFKLVQPPYYFLFNPLTAEEIYICIWPNPGFGRV